MVTTSAPFRRINPLRLILIDHLPSFHDSLRQAIKPGSSLNIVAESDCAEDILAGNINLNADVALVDVDLLDSSRFKVCQWLVAHKPHLAVLCLAYWDWDSYLVGAYAAGARGVVLRSFASKDLIPLIEKAAIMSIFTRDQLNRIQKWNESFGRTFRSLKPREWQAFWLAVDGLSNQAIASRLDLSENTVEKLMTEILKQFNLNSRAQLISLVFKQHFETLRDEENNRLLTFH
ncbi:MAG TPA: response regulator transcription factor [Anaerolineales bacterium]|nr:response regulator transcription factor [Anaerolineales bacterium]